MKSTEFVNHLTESDFSRLLENKVAMNSGLKAKLFRTLDHYVEQKYMNIGPEDEELNDKLDKLFQIVQNHGLDYTPAYKEEMCREGNWCWVLVCTLFTVCYITALYLGEILI